ncbi:MAG: NAD(P)-binding protein [Lewinellaceae bacterium]|nr:NAD(P)-binding protein [Lewinellaceae bacterium]
MHRNIPHIPCHAKKVLIIGGGMAGMSASAYPQMNGFDTEIFELNTSPGGVLALPGNEAITP